jgi:hypothetical protein
MAAGARHWHLLFTGLIPGQTTWIVAHARLRLEQAPLELVSGGRSHVGGAGLAAQRSTEVPQASPFTTMDPGQWNP